VLAAGSVKDGLYKPPLKPWSEPGMESKSEKRSLGIFPEAILDEDWRIGSRLRQFNRETLFEKINGEAEKFLQEGFISLYFIGLRSREGNEEIDIELYDQGDQTGSMGVFSEYLDEKREIKRRGSAYYFMTPAGAIGRNGRFFFRIAGNRASKNIRLKSEELVDALSRLPGSEEKADAPVGFRVLREGMNIDPERITHKGVNVFQLDFAKDFWFGHIQGEDHARLFVHQAPSAEEASKLFKQIITEQGFDYDIKERSTHDAMMQHSFLKTWFAITQKGRIIYGIEEARDDEAAARMLDALNKVLSYEE
jgi:predicted Zn-dependent peptidase